MAAHRPGTWYRVYGFNRLLAVFAASGWLLFFFSRPPGPFRPHPPDHLRFHLAAEGGEGPQERWEAAQEHALAAERQAAGRVTVNSTKPDNGSGSSSGSGSGRWAKDRAESPSVHDVANAEHDLMVQQPAALRIQQPADTVTAVQPAEAARATAHALTEEALDPVALEAVVRPAAEASVSSPLSAAERRQRRENSAALAKAADMEAIRRAISASVAAAAEGRLPSASVDCAKACNFGEAPGYWRVGPHGRRQWALYDDTCALADLLSLHLQPRPHVEPVAYLGENATFLEATEADLLAAFDWRREYYNSSGTPGKLAVPHVADVVARARQQANQTGGVEQPGPAPQQMAVRRRLAALASAAAGRISALYRGGPKGAAARVAWPWRQGSRGWRSLLRLQWRRRLREEQPHGVAAGDATAVGGLAAPSDANQTFGRDKVSSTGGSDTATDGEDLTGLSEASATAHDIGGVSAGRAAQEASGSTGDGGMADASAEAEAAAHVAAQLQAAVQQSLDGSSYSAASSSGSSSVGSWHRGGSGGSNGTTTNGTAVSGMDRVAILLMGDSIDRDSIIDVCAAASGGEVQPDYFLTHMDEECRIEYGTTSRCLICELPTLVVANQMLWSVHPANPLKAGAGFHLGKRKSAETRLHEGWHLFLQRVGRPPDLMVVAVNFWDLAMYTKHGLGLQPHLNEPLLQTWRRDFGDLLSAAQALAGNTTKLLYHTAPVPAAGPTARDEVRVYKLARAGHVAQLNAAGRAAAKAAGISYVDMALMSAAFHSPEEYLKDKLHPQPWLLLEMFNIYLNILQASAQEC